MVVAALARALVRGDFCYCSAQYKFVSLNPLYEPVNKEERVERRRKEWGIWLSSTSDDLDLISDWWYFYTVYNGDRGGMDDKLTFLLFIFSCLGTVTYLMEFLQIACVRPEFSWTWLQLTILLVEDIPQIVITLLIQDRFSNMTPLGVFNVSTSLYSLMIRLAGELFMNCCYCCEKVEDITANMDVEKGKSYKAQN